MKTLSSRTFLSGTLLGLLAASGLAQVSGWGSSENLQLFNESTTNRSPLALAELGSPLSIATGSTSAYALNADGTVTAWGNNSGNQLGKAYDGAAGSAPSTVLGLPAVSKVFASSLSGFAITSTGTLWAWGYNGWGELGIGSSENALSPVAVGEVGANAKIIGGDSRVLLLKGDGTLWGAGYNYDWNLGLGDRAARNTFTQLPIANVTSAAFGGLRSGIASTADGSVYTWGRYIYGDTYPTPTQVPGLTNIVKVAGVPGAAYAIDASGTVYSWGSTDGGILGRPFVGNEEIPTPIPGLPPIAEVVGGQGGTAYALAVDGSVWAWGNGEYGQIGDGFVSDRYEPVQVPGLSSITSIAAGRNFVLAQSAPARVAKLTGFEFLESSTKGHRNVRAKVTLDAPAGPGGVQIDLASRAAGHTLPNGLATTAYNGLTISAVPSPRPSLKKVWRIRNRTNSTHTYRMLVIGMSEIVSGSVPPNSDGYFVSNALSCFNITILLDDANHIMLGFAGNASGPLPTNLFASVTLPASVVVPEGATEYEFDIWANEVPVDATVEIVATQGDVSKISTLKILLESARALP